MSIRDRVSDIHIRFGLTVSARTLLDYYKKASISFKGVDVYNINKTRQAESLRIK